MQKFFVKLGRDGSYMLKVAENALRSQTSVNLGVQRALAFMDEMMNREAGNYGVEGAELGKRVFKIMRHDA